MAEQDRYQMFKPNVGGSTPKFARAKGDSESALRVLWAAARSWKIKKTRKLIRTDSTNEKQRQQLVFAGGTGKAGTADFRDGRPHSARRKGWPTISLMNRNEAAEFVKAQSKICCPSGGGGRILGTGYQEMLASSGLPGWIATTRADCARQLRCRRL